MSRERMKDLRLDSLKGAYDPDLCYFIIRLLEYCGTCVREGYMKPFDIRIKESKDALVVIKEMTNGTKIIDSYKEFIENFNYNKLFKEER